MKNLIKFFSGLFQELFADLVAEIEIPYLELCILLAIIVLVALIVRSTKKIG